MKYKCHDILQVSNHTEEIILKKNQKNLFSMMRAFSITMKVKKNTAFTVIHKAQSWTPQSKDTSL